MERYFSKANEELFDSNVIYTAILTGTKSLLDRITQEQAQLSQKNKGKALIAYLKYKPNNLL